MSKEQTAVQFLIEQIELALKLNKVDIEFMYRIKTINPIYSIALEKEKKQIVEAFISSRKDKIILPGCELECANEYFEDTYNKIKNL
jgi:hypothetical protein